MVDNILNDKFNDKCNSSPHHGGLLYLNVYKSKGCYLPKDLFMFTVKVYYM